MRKIKTILAVAAMTATLSASAQQVDYSVVSVPQETGLQLKKLTAASDRVALPIVNRDTDRGTISWLTNRILSASADGSILAFLVLDNNATNVYLKDVTRQGQTMKCTDRQNILDFAFSPDERTIAFSEKNGNGYCIYTTDAYSGTFASQITMNENDFSPVFSNDGKKVFFCRQDNYGNHYIYSCDLTNGFTSKYVKGMNPAPVPGEDAIVVTRVNYLGKGEIWKINYKNGTEKCLASDSRHSYTSPSVSPDGRWVVFCGDSYVPAPNGSYYPNVDIFVCDIDGTRFKQMTYHVADDLSPTWSSDSQFIYFISQRGDSAGRPNVWKMSFPH